MREIVFKNLTKLDSRKKDTFLREIFEKDGVVGRTERRCFYFIKNVSSLKEDKGLQGWLDSHATSGDPGKRHFYIMKEHNDGQGRDKLICKIAGTFYAVLGESVYTIGFLHSFKVSFIKAHAA